MYQIGQYVKIEGDDQENRIIGATFHVNAYKAHINEQGSELLKSLLEAWNTRWPNWNTEENPCLWIHMILLPERHIPFSFEVWQQATPQFSHLTEAEQKVLYENTSKKTQFVMVPDTAIEYVIEKEENESKNNSV